MAQTMPVKVCYPAQICVVLKPSDPAAFEGAASHSGVLAREG
jgi:hypothetical protein